MIRWRQKARRKLEQKRAIRDEMNARFPEFERCVETITNQAKEQARIEGQPFIGVREDIMIERLELMLGAERLKEILNASTHSQALDFGK